MKKVIWLLPLLLLKIATCQAQQAFEKLRYELAESVLNDLPRPFIYAKRGADGEYHRLPPMPTDTPNARLLLLDRPRSTDANYQVILAGDGTYEHPQLLKYFSVADVPHMRQQLPASKAFKFEQAKIQEPWVTVVALDTLLALNKRLGWRALILERDSLLQRYGSDRTFFIEGILFSKNRKRALVNVGGDGWETCIYTKARTGWHKETTLYRVEY